MKKGILVFLIAGSSLFLTGCGGGSSEVSNASAPEPTPTPTPTLTPATVTYTVGGTASGLNGSLTIKNNAVDELTINSSGQFTFATPVAQGGQYNVTITTQPSTQTCTLSDYSGTNVSANVTSIIINCADNPPGTTSLSLSAATLALGTSGSSRIFTLTNTGLVAASSINTTASPALPLGTTQSTTCGASLAPGSSCNITITPGSTPSAIAPQAPTPSTLTISGSNTNTLNADVYVLTFGNIYQSGYIFSIDDSTNPTLSIGGKVLAVTNEVDSPWSQNPGSINMTACNQLNDGACNTDLIVAYNSGPSSSYAAGLCKLKTNGSYTNWYLPAICEMNSFGAGCVRQEDVLTNLVTPGIGGLSGYYWSSSQSSSGAAQASFFAQSGGSFNLAVLKNIPTASRCARTISN